MTLPKSILVALAALAILAAPKSALAQIAFLSSSPAIDTIETQDLQAKLSKRVSEREQAGKNGTRVSESDFVVVDVRSEAEVNVSLIPGAITKAEYEQNLALYKGKTVIAYCTVGGRSTRYVKQLQQKNVSVVNYKGSMLEWVKAGLPLVTKDGKPTNRVHISSNRYKIPAQYEAITN